MWAVQWGVVCLMQKSSSLLFLVHQIADSARAIQDIMKLEGPKPQFFKVGVRVLVATLC